MDHNDSDMDGSISNQEEDDDIHESEYDSEDEGVGTMNRVKIEDIGDPDVLARLKQQEQEEREEIERELKAHNARLQREVVAAVQRHAAQAVAAAAAAAGLPTAAHFGSLTGNGLGSPNVGPLPLNTVTSSASATGAAATSTLISSSSPSGTSGSSGPTSSPAIQSIEAGKGYTFEEQFKQLYELSDDPKRKEFLDDVFSYMQKRGTPVNRIPIMAKQVLDLYELYRLVVARGGLVEVINKKIWREITKGLNLPSSITSAAFTLRTQYMKYLYPYECEKEKLSSPEELQLAIDGNRREGRRSSYGHYSEMVGATPPPNMNRNHTSHHTSPLSLVSRQLNGHNSQGLSSGEEDNGSMSSTPTHHLHHAMPQQEALNLEVNPRNSNSNSVSDITSRALEAASRKVMEEALGVTPAKRFLTEEERLFMHAGMSNAHIKVTSRDGRTQLDGGSLVLSMEINGILYQGVLFAQTHRNRLS